MEAPPHPLLCRFPEEDEIPEAGQILASVFGSNSPRCFDEPEKGIEVGLSRKAYSIAGVGPEDVNVLEIHDAASFGELKMTEQLGFCGRGEGGPFAESGATTLGGKIPVNVSGGLISRGHPLRLPVSGRFMSLQRSFGERQGRDRSKGQESVCLKTAAARSISKRPPWGYISWRRQAYRGVLHVTRGDSPFTQRQT